jgi:hypothetical protein
MKPVTFAIPVVFLANIASGAIAEHVTVHDLLANPDKYHEHTVIVRGCWDYGFETSHFFDPSKPDDVIWLEATEQDFEHPEDKKLMLLQQLYLMNGYFMYGTPESATPRVDISDVELEIEAVFTNWDSLESTKIAQKEAEKEGMELMFGAFGHFGTYNHLLSIKRVLWFRCILEAPADTIDGKKESKQAIDPTPDPGPRDLGGSSEG